MSPSSTLNICSVGPFFHHARVYIKVSLPKIWGGIRFSNSLAMTGKFARHPTIRWRRRWSKIKRSTDSQPLQSNLQDQGASHWDKSACSSGNLDASAQWDTAIKQLKEDLSAMLKGAELERVERWRSNPISGSCCRCHGSSFYIVWELTFYYF